MTASFGSPDLLQRLDSSSPAELDELAFGVIGFDADEVVRRYNREEAATAGLDPARVLGRPLFTEVAPCTNNDLVAERFRREPVLDEQLDYVFTLRMRPTPVRLRLLAAPDADYRYMVVART